MRETPLVASLREEFGKGPSRRSRMEGMIPGVVYGPEADPMTVTVAEGDFRSSIKGAGGTSGIFNLDVGGQHHKVVIRELQRDPVTSKIIHVDFHAISMTRPINIMVPVKFKGVPRGVKTDGGIMQTIIRDLEISCLPAYIPEVIEIEVEELGIGDSIHVRDIGVPNAEIKTEARRTVVTIAAPTVIKSVAEEAAEKAEAEEDEVEGEGEEAAEGAETTDEEKKGEG